MQIAILDEDASFRTSVSRLIAGLGHTPSEFRTGKTMMRALERERFHLLLLDRRLPDTGSLEILAWARENIDPSPPVIMMSDRAGTSDIVEGLSAGADDYLTKPINDALLVARVEAVLRRTYGLSRRSVVETFGAHVFDLRARKVTVSGATVATTDKEFALALLLFRNLHRPLSRNDILDQVWGFGSNHDGRTLDAHIAGIRRRLGLRLENGLILSAVYRFGYRLQRVEQPSNKGALNGP